jgi:hypothetical protein
MPAICCGIESSSASSKITTTWRWRIQPNIYGKGSEISTQICKEHWKKQREFLETGRNRK